MHITRRIMQFALIALAMHLSDTVAAAAPATLRLGYSDVETYPYQMGNGNDIANPPGVAVEIIQQAALDLGVAVHFQRFPNKRLPFALKEGAIDGMFIFSFNEERGTFARYPMKGGKLDGSRRIANLGYYLYRLQGSGVDWDGRKITGVVGSVGANAGYSVVDQLKKLGVAVEEAKRTEQNFNKLKIGRLAAVAAQSEMADGFLAKGGFATIEKISEPLAAKDYFLAFSHAYADANGTLTEKLWNRIAEIRDQKTKELLPKYPVP